MSADQRPKWTIHDALAFAIHRLAGTSEAHLAADMLLAHVLGCEPSFLMAHPDQTLTPTQGETFKQLVARRTRHEPVPYLIGHRPFVDLSLHVDPRVLIPRPETELLVELAVDIARRRSVARIVDVGTGSGAIAIALARQLLLPTIFATDISTAALDVARANAQRAGVAGRIQFMHGDLLAPLTHPVDLIVANLPYVSETEYAALPSDIRDYEPRGALLSGEQGLDAIQSLLAAAPQHLTARGAILLEIGHTQAGAVIRLARQAFPNAQATCLQDYAHQDRFCKIDQDTGNDSQTAHL